ncbi:MAG: Crp/Fnr family transcriptional regulator [Flavobacteriaceae bacterium]|nr:Crp/Fnr family transcriptional regulator [Flavobacteriaceae bacterium]
MTNCDQCITKQFNSLGKLSKKQLVSISDHKSEATFKKGETVFKEGDNLNGIFCVRSGNVKLSKLSSNGKDQIVRFVKEGELLGYRSVISRRPTGLTVTALDDIRTCYISKNKIFDMLKSNPNFSLDIFRAVSYDLNEANITLTNMAQKTVRERLSHTLIFLEETFGVDNEGNIKIHLSREEIANVIGTATESAIRLLSEFKKEEIIFLKGKHIKILDIRALKKIALGF